ncbi:MAG: MBL fold metallo-hydrolase [Clostridiales Family XIII bacterium]|jgi:L-ascorbate metabolism protein UlaG (beta-lactamase superfamily)|nr:MBL fold metallo-hydrolase [Clostridiales Family XIII bacterium]
MKFYYQGHGSYRFTADDGRVIYVDPYAGGGYDLPADIILVTHGHHDHNKVELVTRRPGCVLITNAEALAGGTHAAFDFDGIKIEATVAGNKNHDPKKCVGFILTCAGSGEGGAPLTIYCSGDTSKTERMAELAERRLDYAIICGDGVYNMDLDEAAECAEIIGAKHNIPVHLKPSDVGELFDREGAEKWAAPNKLIVLPGEEITL